MKIEMTECIILAGGMGKKENTHTPHFSTRNVSPLAFTQSIAAEGT